ncbi:hypothetical protein IJG72_04115 [bacterium]|nr:hypothetical protein [bacterium]
MYVNKCIKCGCEFETKNPKRVICPNCLYPDKNMMPGNSADNSEQNANFQNVTVPQNYSTEDVNNNSSGYSQSNYSSEGYQAGSYSTGGYSAGGGYSADKYNRNERGGYSSYSSGGNYQSRGGYDNRNQGYPQRGGYDNRRGNYNNSRPQSPYPNKGGYNTRNPQRNNFNRGKNPRMGMQNRKRPHRPQAKQLLVNREQLEQIELLYKPMLPLPNPDAHEVIAEKIGLEPRKVFFGINLIRQKMMLPKLQFQKRKLAISPDQLMAIRSLYEPMLPLPPIGCHKIIALQLRMDEWRVHVGIGLIRSQMGLERWNSDRPDAPEEFRNKTENVQAEADVQEEKPKKTRKTKKSDENEDALTVETEDKPKTKAKSKTKKSDSEDVAESEVAQVSADSTEEPEKKKRGRKPKKADE